ncbi:MAG: hypothetical protein IT462_13890 [Planctomycetes bacterium]|nr:hypothetical protein [Planctomycetota bacterium]
MNQDEQNPEVNQQPDPMVEFEYSSRQAASARFALNLLVILSAAASSLFLVYVLARVIPRGGGPGASVNVPTSAVAPRVGQLSGTHIGAALDFSVKLRDIDEAAGYRDQLSEQMRNALGVSARGRIYRLQIENSAKSALLQVKGGSLHVNAKAGGFDAGWLGGVASADKADSTGKLLLAQSAEKFDLQPGESRTMYVFVAATGNGLPPAAEDMTDGVLKLEGIGEIALRREEVATGQ